MHFMKILTLLSLALAAPRAFLNANPLEVGALAPAMEVRTDSGDLVDLASVYAQGPVLIYFYPKAGTPGCTKQACNLRDNFDAVREAGITVLGVSRDSVKAQADFKASEGLPFSLIADEKGELGKAFQVGSFGGMVWRRQSFLVVDGMIAWRDLSATPGSQAEDAVAALEAKLKEKA